MVATRNVTIFLALAMLTGVSVTLLNESKPSMLLIFPILVTLLFVFLSAKGKSLYDHLIVPFMASTIFVQSSVIGGFNVSISDVYLGFIALLLIPANKGKLDLPMKYLFFIGVYLAYCVMSFGWADDWTKSIPRFIQFVEFMVIGVIIMYNISKVKTFVKLLDTFIVVSTLIALAAFFSAMASGFSGPLYVFGFHKNALGAFIGNSIPVIYGVMLYKAGELTNKGKFFYRTALVLNIFVLLFSQSRGSMLGAFVGIAVLLFLSNRLKKAIPLLVGAALCFWVFVTYIAPDYTDRLTEFGANSSAYSRVMLYEHVMAEIRERPWFGHGITNYSVYLPKIDFLQDDPNNFFLLTLVELGIVGTALFTLLLVYFGIVAIKNKARLKNDPKLLILSAIGFSAFISQFAHNQVDVSWVRGTGMFMFLGIGMMLVMRYKKDKLTDYETPVPIKVEKVKPVKLKKSKVPKQLVRRLDRVIKPREESEII